jgi:hypothetical protein
VSFFKTKANSFFKRRETHIPQGSCYAVLRGDYYGEIFCFFEQENDLLYFVSLPKMELREVKKTKFDLGIEEKILDPIEKLPKNVYKILKMCGNNLIVNK